MQIDGSVFIITKPLQLYRHTNRHSSPPPPPPPPPFDSINYIHCCHHASLTSQHIDNIVLIIVLILFFSEELPWRDDKLGGGEAAISRKPHVRNGRVCRLWVNQTVWIETVIKLNYFFLKIGLVIAKEIQLQWSPHWVMFGLFFFSYLIYPKSYTSIINVLKFKA